MTHDELLAEINEYIETCEPYCSSHIVENMPWVALRAVVELHRPVMAFTGGYDGEENQLRAEQCSDCSGNGFSQEYPCQTIKAIEKELQ